MIYKVLNEYSKLIKSYEIKKFHQIENAYAVVVEFTLLEGYKLYVKDYLFLDGDRKYSFHFQDKESNLVFRYDNAPHWPDILTFPYHKHLPDKIEESKLMNLEKVFSEIKEYFEKNILSL